MLDMKQQALDLSKSSIGFLHIFYTLFWYIFYIIYYNHYTNKFKTCTELLFQKAIEDKHILSIKVNFYND